MPRIYCNHKHRHYVAVDIGGTTVRLCLANEHSIIAEKHFYSPITSDALAEILIIYKLLEELLTENQLSKTDLTCIAIALGASFDAKSMMIVAWPNRPSWTGLDLVTMTRTRFGCEVLVEDDANAAAYGEFTRLGEKDKSLLFISLGTGIGCGIILNGAIYKGSNNWAGELGHTTVVADGEKCSCGKNGCLQKYASGKALLHFASTIAPPGLIVDEPMLAFDYAKQLLFNGNSKMQAFMNSFYNLLGLAIANVVIILDINNIVIGGSLLNIGHEVSDKLFTRIEKEFVNPHRVNLQLAASLESSTLHGILALGRSKFQPVDPSSVN